MNRSSSAQEFVARRHALPESSPGVPMLGSSPGPAAPSPTMGRASPSMSSLHGTKQHGGMLPCSALRVAVAVIVVFVIGISVGSVVRLEYYLHRKASLSATWVNDDTSGNPFAGRVIKRTQHVWAVRTETYQPRNDLPRIASNSSEGAQHAAAGAPLPAGRTAAASNHSQPAEASAARPPAVRLPAARPPAVRLPAARPPAVPQQPSATAGTDAHRVAITQHVDGHIDDHLSQQPQADPPVEEPRLVEPLQQQPGQVQPQPLELLRQEQIEEAEEEAERQGAAQAAAQQAADQAAQQAAQAIPQHQQQAHVAAAMAAALRANPGAIPRDFDWRLYVAYYPDLVAAGITNEEAAKGHYAMIGKQENRLYKLLPITMRYTACGGLMNQHYSHLAALALGVVLHANVVVPPALSRNSFNAYFSQDPSKNKVTWAAASTSTMWDTAQLHAYWKERGINITEAPATIALPDMSRPESAYPTWLPRGYSWDQVARLGSVYLKAMDMGKLATDALAELAQRAIALKDPTRPLLLDLPCTLFMLDTSTAPHLVPEVARTLAFAPHMQALANKVLAGMAPPAPATLAFNGLHLRMEADAKDWAQILGGRGNLFQMYLHACRASGFNTSTGMFLASGIFTYKNHSAQHTELQELKTVSSQLYYKELYLTSATDLAGLTNEQLALIDFLVLAQARHFVGISVSTFSFFLREYRLMHGLTAATTTLVDGSRIGTEHLFHTAGRVIL